MCRVYFFFYSDCFSNPAISIYFLIDDCSLGLSRESFGNRQYFKYTSGSLGGCVDVGASTKTFFIGETIPGPEMMGYLEVNLYMRSVSAKIITFQEAI